MRYRLDTPRSWGHAAAAALLAVAVGGAARPPSPLRAAAATIDVDAGTVAGPISPLLYGQFAEFMYQDIKGGLSAELLHNRGFDDPSTAAGLSRGWERYPDDRNDDYGIAFTSDDEVVPSPTLADADGVIPNRSLRVELKPAVIRRHGIYQARVPIRAGVEYRGSLWARADGFSGDVAASLEADTAGGRVYARDEVGEIAGGWKQYAFTLRPAAADPLARFAIVFSGQGTVWIDQVSLAPGDAVAGVRRDVYERIRGLKPAFLRWPGGNVAQDYHWRWGVGPRDARPTWINLSWNHELENGDFGTDEYIALARSLGAEPSLTVNVEGRGATAAEAAAWVEYCNGPATSKYGALRAAGGHPEAYAVKYWEVGNEIWGEWVRGHSDAATYARNFDAYARAMRAVDPDIRVIAVGDNDMAWNRTVLGARERFDYLAVHHYYSRRDMDGDLRNLLARPLHYERWYGEAGAWLAGVPESRRPRLAINEWGLDLPESQVYSIAAALYGARLMNVFERSGGLVAMSAVSDLVNGWPGGIIQASRHRVFVSPIYLVNRLYATHLGTSRLAVDVEGPTFSTTREGQAVPALDVVSSRSANGELIYIKAVNLDLDRPLRATIRVRGARVARSAVVDRVVSDSLDAVNGFDTPEAIRAVRTPVAAASVFELRLPAHSIAVVTLRVCR